MEIHVNDQLTINSTAVTVVSPERSLGSGKRDNITIVNSSTGGQVITIAIDAQAQAGHGFPLSPGGSIDRETIGGHDITQKMITAISSADGGLLSIHEEVRR